MDYKKAYTLLAGVMSNTMNEINKSDIKSEEIENVMHMLKDGLTKAEEMYGAEK